MTKQEIAGMVEKAGACLVWTGWRNRNGYGLVVLPDKKMKSAHRYFWELERGPIPNGLELDHLCNNRSCVRVDHLEPVTRAENVRRAAKTHCPEGHPYDAGNTYTRCGQRYCRACRSVLDREYRTRQRNMKIASGTFVPYNGDKLRCIRGHRFDEDNTALSADGRRQCKACRRIKMAEWKTARKSRRLDELVAPGTRCVNGHLFDEANTYFRNGIKNCRACGRENARRYRAMKRQAVSSAAAA